MNHKLIIAVAASVILTACGNRVSDIEQTVTSENVLIQTEASAAAGEKDDIIIEIDGTVYYNSGEKLQNPPDENTIEYIEIPVGNDSAITAFSKVDDGVEISCLIDGIWYKYLAVETSKTVSLLEEEIPVDELPDADFHESLPAGQVNYELIEIKPQCGPAMGFTFGLPAGWKYDVVQTEDEPTSSTQVYIRNENESNDSGCIIIACDAFGLAVCGTGLEEKSIDFNGHPALQGFYDESDIWSFISLDNAYILNNAELYTEYRETVDLMLSTVEFRMYENSTINTALNYEVVRNNDYTVSEKGYRSKLSEAPYSITVCSGEHPTGGYSIDVIDVTTENGSDIIITVEETKPSDGDVVTEAFTYPACTVLLDAFPESITVKDTLGNEYKCLD